MSRIPAVDPASATGEARQLLDAVQAQLGVTPNFIRVLANSPSALKAFLGIYQIAGEGRLEAQTRERIALAVAQENACEYCVSAHTAIGRKHGLSNEEMLANRGGGSTDERAAAAVSFAKSLMENRGDVSGAEVQAIRNAGYGDAELVEIIVHVALNALTNILGKAAQVDIDFPHVSLSELPQAA
ncbi:carboxymuconolactone decarboxylase family protein [Sinimarinibacterium sp. CAU 1509]|uniref:carboxymuconolactone decarboxylase family protein n=1 Tax=Sinimarinibacterium sp. CAU 1509 TaxID=2562283 RepID=UPI0010AD785A|nr:peroxidase-related enzyme [Sinimarinibacterium sp. CAU 1509]TJY62279.1 carboxymuconolactone decarboxylase family protein [Sinimarinibacterium sp. CAU 1509]